MWSVDDKPGCPCGSVASWWLLTPRVTNTPLTQPRAQPPQTPPPSYLRLPLSGATQGHADAGFPQGFGFSFFNVCFGTVFTDIHIVAHIQSTLTFFLAPVESSSIKSKNQNPALNSAFFFFKASMTEKNTLFLTQLMVWCGGGGEVGCLRVNTLTNHTSSLLKGCHRSLGGHRVYRPAALLSC